MYSRLRDVQPKGQAAELVYAVFSNKTGKTFALWRKFESPEATGEIQLGEPQVVAIIRASGGECAANFVNGLVWDWWEGPGSCHRPAPD
eukprot:764624-Hanusia_phi.AAC.3